MDGQKRGFVPGKGALATLVLASMLNVMGGAAVASALPAMSQAFPEASETAISLVITLPSLAVAVSGVFVGLIADRIGKARMLKLSLVVFTLAGLSGLVAPTLPSLLAGRLVMGVGIAGIAASTAALISQYYDDAMRPKVYGWQNAATGASVLLLETLGGLLALNGWRAPFAVYLVGIAFLALSLAFIREPEGRPAAAAAQKGKGTGLFSGAAGRVAAVCFAAAALSQTLSYLVPSKLPYLVDALGQSTAVTGLFLGGFGVANIAGALASAPLTARLPRSSVTAACFGLLAAGCLFMAFGSGLAAVLAGAALMGAGVGCVTPVFMNLLARQATPETSGLYMGAFATACNLGQFACSLLSGAVMAFVPTQQAVFAAGAAIGLAAAAAAIALRPSIDV